MVGSKSKNEISLPASKQLKQEEVKIESDKAIGSGGFGKVYLGKSKAGRLIVIKKSISSEREKELQTEIWISSKLRKHRNIVELIGWKRDEEGNLEGI